MSGVQIYTTAITEIVAKTEEKQFAYGGRKGDAMTDDDIKAIRDWCKSDERTWSYSHTEEDDGEDVIFVSMYEFEEFADWLRENVMDLIYIPGKIGNDGVWFSSTDLERAKFY